MTHAHALLPRRIAVPVMLCLGCTFAANHVAARVAFDHGTGLLVAVMARTLVAVLVLTALVLWQREPLRVPAGYRRWLVLVGLMTVTQSVCMYTAVAKIPVALALLVANVFPLLLALWTWLFGGPPPTRRACLLMGLILFGLCLALDLPARLSGASAAGPDWTLGVSLAFCAATSFSLGLWIVDHKLRAMSASVRSLLTMAIVLCAVAVVAASSVVPGGMAWPHGGKGWVGLALLALLYGVGFSVLYVLLPRLDMARNAPVMNIEPVATLVLGWLVLGQMLAPIQLLGALVVVSGIVLLAYRRAG